MKPEEFRLGKAFGIDPVKARDGEGDVRDLGILYGARDAMNSASSILAHASSRAYLDAATDDELREEMAAPLRESEGVASTLVNALFGIEFALAQMDEEAVEKGVGQWIEDNPFSCEKVLGIERDREGELSGILRALGIDVDVAAVLLKGERR